MPPPHRSAFLARPLFEQSSPIRATSSTRRAIHPLLRERTIHRTRPPPPPPPPPLTSHDHQPRLSKTPARPFPPSAFQTHTLHTASANPQKEPSPSPAPSSSSTNPRASTRPSPPQTPDRGPRSSEPNQTDFAALNVLSAAPSPTTSVDVCTADGFLLDSGLRVGDGDGVLLLGGEAFVWRPWMVGTTGAITSGETVRKNAKAGRGGGDATGGLVDTRGMFDVRDGAWAVLEGVWPRPDLLVIGTGAQIRPLSPRTRAHLHGLGYRVEVLDTRNAASSFNLLATERGVGEVAAALVPVGFGT